MKCSFKDQRIGMFLCVSFFITISHSYPEGRTSVHDLCSSYNGIVNVDDEISFQLVINSFPVLQTPDRLRYKKMCTLQFKVCPSCHLEILMSNMDIPSCSKEICRCNFFEVKEPWSDFSKKFCGKQNDLYFESKTKYVSIDFSYDVHETFRVTLNFTARRNVYIIIGTPNDEDAYRSGYIESPYFPVKYPSDYSADYIFHSLGCIELIFVDFLLSPHSFIEVEGHHEKRVDTFSGSMFRPPAIISSGPFLILRFFANDQSSRPGFRARYIFSKSCDENMKPYTDCGSNIHGYGGIISLNVPAGSDHFFDCVWLIHVPEVSQKPLSAVITKFKDTGISSFLEFREGLTSKSNLVKKFQCHSLNCDGEIAGSEVLIPPTSSFYVRMVGYLTMQSSMIISYASFNENGCRADEFSCHNGRCIKRDLYCDGYNHCVDNSDEKCEGLLTVAQTSSQTVYSVPEPLNKEKESGHFGLTSLILIIVAGVIIFVIVITFIVVTRLYKNRPSLPRQEQTQPLHIMNENLDRPRRTMPTILATFDDPPSYEDVIKFRGRYPPLSYEVCGVENYDYHDIQDSITDLQENVVQDTNTQSSNHFVNTVDVFHVNCVVATHLPSPLSSVLSVDEVLSTPVRDRCEVILPCKCKDRFNRSLDSIWKCDNSSCHMCHGVNIAESSFSFMPIRKIKVARCFTLPSDYKLPERKCQILNCSHSSKSVSLSNLASEGNKVSCSNGTNLVNDVGQYNCSFVTSFSNFGESDGLPFVRNRCTSSPLRENYTCVHHIVSKKKATTL